jgi:CheY-like chemotaxis protein
MASQAVINVDPVALVCVDDAARQAAVTQALEELGYRGEVGTTVADVTDRLRKVSYDVIVLDEAFQGATTLDNPLLVAIQSMPMPVRRYIFVALLGRDVKTLDHMLAFAKSVNLVVNYSDVPQLQALLTRAVADNDQFYRVFRQVLQEAGKR